MIQIPYFQTFSLRMKCSAHAFGTVLAFICIFLSTSCVTDYDTPETADGKMILNLRLDTSGMFTRSNDGSEVSNGMSATVDENYINWEDVWIAAFDAATGNRIGVLHSPGDQVGSESGGNRISASVDVSEYSGDVRIVALANWGRYGIAISDLNKIMDIKDLNDLTFSFTPDNLKNTESKTEYCPLPMFGSETIATGFPLAKEKDVSISMTRALAKIEIVDNLNGDVRIESATLCNYAQSGKVVPSGGTEDVIGSQVDVDVNAEEGTGSTVESLGRDLPFNKIEGESGKSTFYVYVPEISLGEADSDIRKIALKLSDGNNSEISLINYDENKQPSAEISDDWKSLKRNHIYRFNVNALISTEPEIEIQPTIRICWYETRKGKFRGVMYWEELYLHIFSFDEGSIPNLLDNSENPISVIKNFEVNGNKINDLYFDYLDSDINGVDIGDLSYIISIDKWRNAKYDQDSFRNLKMDVMKFENIISEYGKVITYCWLNSMPLYFLIDSYVFPNDAVYRIYWNNEQEDYSIGISDESTSKSEFTIQKKEYDTIRKLWFVEFTIVGSPTSIKVEYKKQNNSIDNVTLETSDFFTEKVGSQEYYVFYAN